MEGYKISINSKNEKRIISRDEMEFIHLKTGYSDYNTINKLYHYNTDEVYSYWIICYGRTGALLADLSEEEYLNYQNEFENYYTSKYRRCA